MMRLSRLMKKASMMKRRWNPQKENKRDPKLNYATNGRRGL